MPQSYAVPVGSTERIRSRRKLTTVIVPLLALVLAAAAVLWASTYRSAPQQEPLTLATGLNGGVYYELGQALEGLTQDSEVPLAAQESAASQVNVEMIVSGEVDAGFSTSDVAAVAARGEPPFDRPLPIRAVGRMYDQPLHLVVLADSEYQRLTDLEDTTISAGADGSGTRVAAERVLEVAGLEQGSDLEDVSMDLAESVEALEDGDIAAFFWSGGLPSQAVTELAERTPIRLIDLSEWAGPLAEQGQSFYEDVPVPVDTYPGVPGVRSIGVSSLLIVSTELPDSTVESLTGDLFGSRADLVEVSPVIRQLHERSALNTQPVELHPGALEYYQRAKPAHRSAQRGHRG